ncbi:ribulose-phosphate 3-epimerase [Polluticaenibacter yanchengensis]|uniref:Ribulose-phosphate 3-epimerase n=1 Tax=Polluticaenibacter yanchengensis TaxID=3014562 RepID=A0ABT4UPH5_9BACT|nr:ribulose-phosphate 3-epimerase [Chitinophagaceae bacterium LY-5]
MAIIAPSLLAADFLNLSKDIELFNNSEAEWLHLDIMDGRFVPNISYGFPVLEKIRKATDKVFDVHLMIEEPEKYTEWFKAAGADILTVHYEACRHLHRNIQQIKSLGMKAGVALNPHTPINVLYEILPDVDMVLLMSVNPGFGGQSFIPNTINKIKKLRTLIDEMGLKVEIEIDGGISAKNAKEIVDAGATVLVAGSAVFGAPDPVAVIKELKSF